jgi:hypothetical protein
MATGGQRCEGRTGWDRKSLGDHHASGPHGSPVSRSVGDNKEHHIDFGVASLERDPAELRLRVIEAGFAFGVERLRGRFEPGDHRVPRPKITLELQWDFRPQCQSRSQPRTKTVKQGDLAGISKWRWPWICANPNIETDDSPDPRQLRNRDAGKRRALDPADIAVRHPDSSTDIPKRLSRRDAGSSQVGSDCHEVMPGETRPPVSSTFSIGHRHILPTGPCLTVI